MAKQFKDLGIQPVGKTLKGTKIEMQDVFDKEIVIHDFKIGPSKYPKK